MSETKTPEVNDSMALVVKEISPLLNEQEQEEFEAFLHGETATPPALVTRAMTSLANKLTMVAGCDMLSSIPREANLDAFMLAAESRLFDPAALAEMDTQEVEKRYEKASKQKLALAESRRKFLAQNRDSLLIPGSPYEKLLTQIMSMSPEQLKKLKDSIADISSEVIEHPDQAIPVKRWLVF